LKVKELQVDSIFDFDWIIGNVLNSKKRQQQDLNLRGKTQQISSLPP
jgi:hypothetical protein